VKNKRRLRNRIYFGIFPLMLLMLGLSAYLILAVNNLHSAYGDDRLNPHKAQELVNSIQFELGTLQQRLLDKQPVGAIGARLERLTEPFLDEEALPEGFPGNTRTRMHKINQLGSIIEDSETPSAPKLSIPRTLAKIEAYNDDAQELQNWLSSQLAATSERVQKQTTQSYYVMTSGMILSVFLSLYISAQLSSRILKPVEAMQQTINSITNGNFDVEPQLHTDDEMGDVARALLAMTARLRYYRELNDQNVLRLSQTLRTVLQRSHDAIIVCDSNLRVTYRNPAAESFLQTREFRTGFPSAIKEILRESQRTKQPVVVRHLDEALMLRIGGEDRFFFVHAFPIAVADLERFDASSATGSATETALAMTLQEVSLLRLSDRLKDNLVATVSHELKTPLTSARMSLYLLAEQQIGKLNADQLELVNTAKDDLNRQLSTIQNLLDLSRIKNSEEIMHLVEFEFADIITDSIAAHEELAEAHDVKIVNQVSPPLCQIEADQYRVTVVLNNLLSNAIRHTGNGSTVRISADITDTTASISVHDEGPGIPQDQIAQLFDAYHSSEHSRNQGGTGLGLAIAQRIMQKHGGSLTCQSTLGQGSVFTLSLPLKLPAKVLEATSQS
jgi:signal transduction histidine kinase